MRSADTQHPETVLYRSSGAPSKFIGQQIVVVILCAVVAIALFCFSGIQKEKWVIDTDSITQEERDAAAEQGAVLAGRIGTTSYNLFSDSTILLIRAGASAFLLLALFVVWKNVDAAKRCSIEVRTSGMEIIPFKPLASAKKVLPYSGQHGELIIRRDMIAEIAAARNCISIIRLRDGQEILVVADDIQAFEAAAAQMMSATH